MNHDEEIMRVLGKLEAGQDNLLSYVKAVSDNQKGTARDLETHKDQLWAHGIGAASTAVGALIGVATAILGWVLGGKQ